MAKQTITWVKTGELKEHRKRTGPHNLSGKLCHWAFCTNCRLLALKNKATRKALKAKCVWYEDVG